MINKTGVYIIAEAGVNHNGDIGIAKKMVDAALKCGVDAIKFQTFKSESIVTKYADRARYQKLNTKNNDSQYEMLKKLELSFDNFIELSDYCKGKKLEFLSTPFDFESADFLNDIGVKAFKISSGDITNIPFLQHIAKKNKPMIISTGMSNLGEIEEAIRAIKDMGNNSIYILHCTSNYPAKLETVNLNAIDTLKAAFKLPVGYSDHTEGIEIPIAAAAKGACIIEKHFTLNKNFEGPDHKASLDVEELNAMVRAIRNVEKAMGDGIKKCTADEMDVKTAARKSIVASRFIKKGEIIRREDISFKRSGSGISPKDYNYIINKRAKRDIEEDEQIHFLMIEE